MVMNVRPVGTLCFGAAGAVMEKGMSTLRAMDAEGRFAPTAKLNLMTTTPR